MSVVAGISGRQNFVRVILCVEGADTCPTASGLRSCKLPPVRRLLSCFDIAPWPPESTRMSFGRYAWHIVETRGKPAQIH